MVWKQEYQVENTAYAMTAIIQNIPSFYYFLHNLENICYFPSFNDGIISLHHSFTPSFTSRWTIWKPGGNSDIKKQEMLVGKFEFD